MQFIEKKLIIVTKVGWGFFGIPLDTDVRFWLNANKRRSGLNNIYGMVLKELRYMAVNV